MKAVFLNRLGPSLIWVCEHFRIQAGPGEVSCKSSRGGNFLMGLSTGVISGKPRCLSRRQWRPAPSPVGEAGNAVAVVIGSCALRVGDFA